MAGFLYFASSRQSVTPNLLLALGLGDAFPDGSTVTQRQCSKGPDGHSGVVVAWGAPKVEVGYFPEKQTWAKCLRSECWLGFETADPPRPEELARERTVGFYTAPLGDGRRWIVPTGVFEDGASPLPKVRRLSADGSIERRVAKEYESLYLAADAVRSAIRDREDLDDRREWEIAVEALRVNYRVGADEVSALGLLTDAAVVAMFQALVDRGNWADVKAHE